LNYIFMETSAFIGQEARSGVYSNCGKNFNQKCSDDTLSIHLDVREEIHDNQTEIRNKTDLDKKDESVSTYNLKYRDQINKPSRHLCTAFITDPINYNDAITCEQADKYTDGSIHLQQLNYANKLISKFNLMDVNVFSTPIDRSYGAEQNLTTSDNQFPYR
ncbi:Uncharacterized protein FWK35_00009227, partial [Aphis craccivora]